MQRRTTARRAVGLAFACCTAALAACSVRSQPLPPAPEPRLADSAADAGSSAAIIADSATAILPPGTLSLPLETDQGSATYYADRFHGRRTASGSVFSNDEMLAAHRTYPFGTILRVTNLANDRSVVVTVVDRGPHGASASARRLIVDVSRRAAAELDFVRQGVTPVRIDVLAWGD
jgi:rare lipoprotein A